MRATFAAQYYQCSQGEGVKGVRGLHVTISGERAISRHRLNKSGDVHLWVVRGVEMECAVRATKKHNTAAAGWRAAQMNALQFICCSKQQQQSSAKGKWERQSGFDDLISVFRWDPRRERDLSLPPPK